MKKVLSAVALALLCCSLQTAAQTSSVRVGPIADDEPASTTAPAAKNDNAARPRNEPKPASKTPSKPDAKTEAKLDNKAATKPEGGTAAPAPAGDASKAEEKPKVDEKAKADDAAKNDGKSATNSGDANKKEGKTKDAAANAGAAGKGATKNAGVAASVPAATPSGVGSTMTSDAPSRGDAATIAPPVSPSRDASKTSAPASSTSHPSSTPNSSTTPGSSSTPNSSTAGSSTAPSSSTTSSSTAPGSSPTSSPSSASSASAPASSSPSPATPTAPARVLAPTEVYRVGAGDVLDIRLLNQGATRESTLFTIMEGGLLEYPLAGGPRIIGGLTTEEIAAQLTAEMKRRGIYEKPRVVVSVREYASHTVLVSGLVEQPGARVLRRDAVPLFVVLAEAQPRPEAGRAVLISRKTGQSTTIDLTDDAGMSTLVSSGDVVQVQSRPREFFYIGGQIAAPGQKDFHAGMTLTQAVLASGGVTATASGKVRVARQGPDGRLVSTEYNLNDIEAGQVPDPRIQPGDRIELTMMVQPATKKK